MVSRSRQTVCKQLRTHAHSTIHHTSSSFSFLLSAKSPTTAGSSTRASNGLAAVVGATPAPLGWIPAPEGWFPLPLGWFPPPVWWIPAPLGWISAPVEWFPLPEVWQSSNSESAGLRLMTRSNRGPDCAISGTTSAHVSSITL